MTNIDLIDDFAQKYQDGVFDIETIDRDFLIRLIKEKCDFSLERNTFSFGTNKADELETLMEKLGYKYHIKGDPIESSLAAVSLAAGAIFGVFDLAKKVSNTAKNLTTFSPDFEIEKEPSGRINVKYLKERKTHSSEDEWESIIPSLPEKILMKNGYSRAFLKPELLSEQQKWWDSLTADWQDVFLNILDVNRKQFNKNQQDYLDKLLSMDRYSFNDIDYFFFDISPLSKLINLTQIRILSEPIKDLSPLKNLTKLTHLVITSCPDYDICISDISPLENLTKISLLNLENRSLEDNDCIVDISILRNFEKLENLNLKGHRISDLSPLKALNNIRELNLAWNQISDITILENLINLEKLNLKDNPIAEEDIEWLKGKLPNCEITF